MLPVLAGCGGGASAVAIGAQSGAIAYVTTGAFEALLGTSITPVELTDNRALSPITVGSLPSALAATSDGRRLLVTLQGENHLVVLDTAGDSVLGTVTTGLQPDAVAVGGPNDATALVANLGDGTVTPVDLSTMTAGRAIPVGSEPDAVAVGGPNDDTALVANLGDGTVTPVDLSTMTAGHAIPVGPGPTGVAESDATAWVSVGSSLVPITLSTMTAGPAIAVGHVAQAVALGPGATTAWVAGVDGTVTPVDLRTGRARRAIHVGGKPSAILIPRARA
jgi:hyaluronoglucosaminidase